MKLEEVLPAMRAGRVAFNEKTNRRYRLRGETMEVEDALCREGWRLASLAWVDGWTLEPEPKVEWPKGSLQWAIEKVGRKGHVRQRGHIGAYHMPHGLPSMTYDELLALDWEVVP